MAALKLVAVSIFFHRASTVEFEYPL